MTATMETIGRALKPDRAPAKRKTTTKKAAVDAIVRETNVTRARAESFVNWIDGLVQRARANGYQTHLLTRQEIRDQHGILEAIAPDGAVAKPGSAHHAVETHVLNPKKGELGLLHDQMFDHVTHCTVQVRMSVVGK